MPRCKVVATAALALALALMLASCSESTNSIDPKTVAGRQEKLNKAHEFGKKAHESMAQFGLEATENECKAHYAATMAHDLGSDAMVDLGRHYFVTGCMKKLPKT
jgi:hypothetical protein